MFGGLFKYRTRNAWPVLCALIAGSCAKEPSASFQTDKTEYVAGETVRLTNTSANATTYLWTLPNGLTAEAAEPSYTIPETAPSGEIEFTLVAGNEDKKTASVTKSVRVVAATGTITAWTFNGSVGVITVKSGDAVLGTIGAYYQFNPGCGANGCVTATLNVGVHAITAVYAGTSSSGTVTIKKNQCTTYELQ